MTIRLKALRLERKWTQADLASMLGVSPSHISEMEQGKKNPSRPLLAQMATIFHVPIADMYEVETDDPSIQSMVNGIRSLSETNRQIVIDMISALQKKQGA